MDITGEYTIPATKQDVWDALNDPEILKVCTPGCEEMEKVSDNVFNTKITVKIGAVRTKLKGKVELSDIDVPNSYTISGSGQGGVAGFVKGGAKVNLSSAPDGGTNLFYAVQVDLGGKLAAVGSRVIQGVAKKLADDFFGKFAMVLNGELAEAATSAPVAQPLPVDTAGAALEAGIPDWVKCAIVNAIVSSIAVAVAVAIVSN